MATRKKKQEFRLNEQQFAEAAIYVQAAQQLLGLQQWRIEVSPEPAHKSNHGQIHLYSDDDLIANLLFGALHEEWTRERICKLVVHELLHPFFHPLIISATRGRGGDGEVSAEEHKLINVLTEILSPIVFDMVEFDEGDEE